MITLVISPHGLILRCMQSAAKRIFFRDKYNLSKSAGDYAKFSERRRAYKRLAERKMRENVLDDNDSTLITKKFWSHVKSKSNSKRIPEVVNLGEIYRSEPLE